MDLAEHHSTRMREYAERELATMLAPLEAKLREFQMELAATRRELSEVKRQQEENQRRLVETERQIEALERKMIRVQRDTVDESEQLETLNAELRTIDQRIAEIKADRKETSTLVGDFVSMAGGILSTDDIGKKRDAYVTASESTHRREVEDLAIRKRLEPYEDRRKVIVEQLIPLKDSQLRELTKEKTSTSSAKLKASQDQTTFRTALSSLEGRSSRLTSNVSRLEDECRP